MTAKKKTAAEIKEEIARLNAEYETASKAEKQEGLTKLREFMADNNLTAEDVIAELGGSTKKSKSPAKASPIIFEFKADNYSFIKQGLKGRNTVEAIATLKTHLPTEEEALKYALNADGEAWVKKVYDPKVTLKTSAKKKTTKKKS